MNRRTFITSLLATTASIPLAKAAPVTMRFTSYGSASIGLVEFAEMVWGRTMHPWQREFLERFVESDVFEQGKFNK